MDLDRTACIRLIHAAQREPGMDDATYRAILRRVGGGDSCKTMDDAGLNRVAAYFRARSAGGAPRPAAAPHNATGPARGHVKKVQALWISLYNLGLVEDRRDSAITAFVTRQTGLQALNWLRDPADTLKVVEALKAMAARDGGVNWQGADGRPRPAHGALRGLPGLPGLRGAVANAGAAEGGAAADRPRRDAARRRSRPPGLRPRRLEKNTPRDVTPQDFRHLANLLGKELRGAQAAAVKAEAAP